MSELRREGAADQIARILGDRILSGALRQGDALTEADLAGEFNVSRNTVREGLRLLTREGLAIHEVHKGVAVRRFTVDEVRQNYAVRAMIQREVGGCPLPISAQTANRLRQHIDHGERARRRGDAKGWMDANHRFHTGLVALVENPRLDALFVTLVTEMRIVFTAFERDMQAHWDDDNRELVDLLEHGDADGYRAAVTVYLETACAEAIAGISAL